MTTSLQQMNIAYLPAEDRLLLKVSANAETEYRIWLTRKFTGLLYKVLQDQIQKAGGEQKISSNEQTTAQLKSGAFEKKYEPETKTVFPLGEEGILAYKITIRADDKNILHLQLLPEEGKGLTIALNTTLLYMLYSLVEQGINKSDWNLIEAELQRANLH